MSQNWVIKSQILCVWLVSPSLLLLESLNVLGVNRKTILRESIVWVRSVHLSAMCQTGVKMGTCSLSQKLSRFEHFLGIIYNFLRH